MALQVLVADDHNLVREGIRHFLEGLEPGVEVVEVGSFTEALGQVGSDHKFDLHLLDLNMPGMEGSRSIKKICAEVDTPVVIVSGESGRANIMGAIEAGAAGFVPKSIGSEAMVHALRLILSGETFIPSSVFSEQPDTDSACEGERFSEENPLSTLSEREIDVLGPMIEGKTNKEIARELDIQEITVKVHLRNGYKKIGASNRADAVRISVLSGWYAEPIR